MAAVAPTKIELPWPPSVNHYYRRVGSRTLISRAGRAFRVEVGRILAARRLSPALGRLAVTVEVFPPDRRRRDIDNLLKAVLDACQHGGAFPDDSRIVWLLIRRTQVVRGGRVVVTIRDLAAGQQPPDDAAIWSPSLN
ncbi:MAG TPA: RusA family crossover junction endodeoxyribonuclease [Phycisphaerae bacterium]|mgnify:CR=1 FL=1|nr:RusA family crossover junction endodeoxyribonuclease [Phycisphaerae bacterium]HPM22961.1 RusA family crossover junction endodeoxyribonuclease [Phycisphaerae bacterium]